MPQISVRSLGHEGFIVPPGFYGFVAAAGLGIIRMAMVDAEAGMSALERLGQPDVESRTPDFDGRRLVRVDGGYIVLNFFKYREKDNTGAERAKRYRMRKALSGDTVTRDSHTVTRDSSPSVTKADADADAESKTTSQPSSKTARQRAPAAPVVTIAALCAEGLAADLAAEYIALRARKRAPLSARAWSGIAAEIGKAGLSLDDGIAKALQRGWVGFEAEWCKPNGVVSFHDQKAADMQKWMKPGGPSFDYIDAENPNDPLAIR